MAVAAVAAAEFHGDGRGLTIRTDTPVEVLNKLTGWALERGIELQALEVRQPSLEDVYLQLVGGEEGDEQ